jgi:hypothetical protein
MVEGIWSLLHVKGLGSFCTSAVATPPNAKMSRASLILAPPI